jgi:type VI secretion system secreted protein VgrG
LAVCVGANDAIASGSASVLIGSLCAARLGDPMIHGGRIIVGLATVLIGGPSSGTLVGILPNGLRIEREPGGELRVGEHLVIDGAADFQSQVVSDILEICQTPTGSALLLSIDGGSHDVTIVETSGGNGAGYDNPSDRYYAPGSSPGPGTNSTVSYNPNRTTLGTEPWETRPPAIGLAHELIHAEQASNGTMSQGMAQNDLRPDPTDPSGYHQWRLREIEAVGIPPNDTRTFTENQIRSEWEPRQPNRDWY